LTSKQRRVLVLVARGLANKEIASRLNCAEVTVEFHVTSLLRRCGAENRTVLAALFWDAAS
jgi:DNA-binding NarL/FixJ family response regulator